MDYFKKRNIMVALNSIRQQIDLVEAFINLQSEEEAKGREYKPVKQKPKPIDPQSKYLSEEEEDRLEKILGFDEYEEYQNALANDHVLSDILSTEDQQKTE